MKAIETMYAGTLFRSRLEARWAVFFDELGIKWEFEPEGYVVGLSDPIADADRTVHYLPDFYLPNTETWVEVKGDEDRLDRDLLCAASDYGLRGPPGSNIPTARCGAQRPVRGEGKRPESKGQQGWSQ